MKTKAKTETAVGPRRFTADDIGREVIALGAPGWQWFKGELLNVTEDGSYVNIFNETPRWFRKPRNTSRWFPACFVQRVLSDRPATP